MGAASDQASRQGGRGRREITMRNGARRGVPHGATARFAAIFALILYSDTASASDVQEMTTRPRPASAALRLAQAGSTGGTIGKTDKSAAGSRDTQEPPKPSNTARPKNEPEGRKSAAVSVAGQWRWSADCQSGHWSGGFQLRQGTSGQFDGAFLHTNASDIGTILNGQIGGNGLSFTRTWTVLITASQQWTGQLGEGGRHISGSITGNENCTWEGRKE
jgi:hypothetical protein